MPCSVVIPSRNQDNLAACIAALRASGSQDPIAVAWDATVPPAIPLPRVAYCTCPPPFCFARNVNEVVRALVPAHHDILLINDDVLIETVGTVEMIRNCVILDSYRIGIISPLVRGPANPVHSIDKWGGKPHDYGVAWIAKWVPFVCVYITAQCRRAVGELDERFTPGSYEDNDYCHRARQRGFEICVHDGCVVDHGALPHTFRPKGEPQQYDLQTNRKRFIDKWGFAP